jgi:hypothetical protein
MRPWVSLRTTRLAMIWDNPPRWLAHYQIEDELTFEVTVENDRLTPVSPPN